MFTVKENGKNGTVEVLEDRVVRTVKKFVGKDDIQTIPTKAITSVHHNRKTLGSDVVTVTTAGQVFTWKVSNGEGLVGQLNAAVYQG